MTDNVSLLAADAQQRSLNTLLRWAVTDTVQHLVHDDPQRAYTRILGSVLGEQARVAGIRTHPEEAT